MKRRPTAALLIIMLPLGMVAYHGTKSRKATPNTPAPTTIADVNPTQAPGQTPALVQAPGQTPGQAPDTSGQSVEQACSLIDNQLRLFADNYNDLNDFAQVLAATEATINTLNSPQIINPDVKQASNRVVSILSNMINSGRKYQPNPNAADPNEVQRSMEDLTTSLYTLGSLCPAMLKQ